MSGARQRRDAGFALVVVIMILGLLAALAAALTTTITMDTALRGAFTRTTAGFYAAESGLNMGMGSLKDKFMAFQMPADSDFTPKTFTLRNRTVTYQVSDPGGNPQTVQIPSGQLFGGLNAWQYVYVVNSQATSAVGTEANVGGEFDVGYIPIFQFLAFYSNDLEIEPGADMSLHGRVHTNGNLYLNSDATLTIQANPPNIPVVQVTAKGDIYRGRKDQNTCVGTVTVGTANVNCNGSATRVVPSSELANWNGGMLSQIQSIAVPQPDITTKGGLYWNSADLRIVLRADQTTPAILPGWAPCNTQTGGCQLYPIEVQNADGTQDAARTDLLRQFMADATYNMTSSSMKGTRPVFYTDQPCGGCSNTQASSYTPAFSSSSRTYASIMGSALGNFDQDYRRGAFFNYRERQSILLLNVNLHDLLDWNANVAASTNRFFDPADTTDGGLLIYITVAGPNSGAMNNGYGVRVFGSANLPFPAVPSGGDPTGLTLVSDQAMYVQGDYNTVTWQPAAIFGDSLNVLSGNYFNTSACGNDCQSFQPLSQSARNATSTTINSAFVANRDVTTPGNYNGGFENYPRFHENWSGQTLTYRGSFVSLGTPQHVSGAWCGTGNTCNIYNPPARNWDYDSRFNNPVNLPPLTPRFVYVQQVFFAENFR